MKGKQAILEPQEPRCLYLKTKNKNANLIFFQGCRESQMGCKQARLGKLKKALKFNSHGAKNKH